MAKQWIAFLGSLLVLGLSARAEAKAPPFDPVSIKERVSYRLVKQDKAYRVENPTYEAAFTEKGLCFVPLTGEDVKGEEMGFSLKAIHGGDEALSFTKKAFTVKENRITYALTQPVEEVYIAREDGIEQVFHVKAPLCSKQEDLIFTVAVDTPLRPKAGHDGIDFFDEKGGKVATYGRVTVFDAKGKEITFLPELRADQIALVVPAAFLKDAVYPVTVDPLIGGNFYICNEGHWQDSPAIAFDGTNYLVVWQDLRNGTWNIYGQRVTTGGGRLGGDFYICNAGVGQYNPAIAFDGTNYLVVWDDYRNGNYDIYGQRISPAGGRVGGNFFICTEGAHQTVPAIAFDGNNYLVVWMDLRNGNFDIYGQRLSTAGGAVGGNFHICTQGTHQTNPAIAFDGNNYLVVWEDYRNASLDIYGQRVTTAGGRLGGNFFICNEGHNQYYPAIAFDGNNYLVVWDDLRNGNYDIYGRRVSTAGGPVGGDFFICNAGHNQYHPAIAFDGDNCLVVWYDYRNVSLDIYGQQVDRSGGRVGANFFICNQGDNQHYPAIAFDGNNYLAVWRDNRNGNYDIYGQRVHISWRKLSGIDPEDMKSWWMGLAVDFGSAGLWNFDDSGGGWSKLSGGNPQNMVKWVQGLATDFGSGGLWNFNDLVRTWSKLSGGNPQNMVWWLGGLAVDFGSGGLWSFDGSSWSKLSGGNPQDMVWWQGGLAVDFGSGGLWNFDGSSWSKLSGGNPQDMVLWGARLAVDFGSGGLWSFDGSSWSKLSGGNPEKIVVLLGSRLAVDFGSGGVWSFDGSSWSKLSGGNPQNMVLWGSQLAVDLGSGGVWSFDGSSWRKLSGGDPQDMVEWASQLAVDLGSAGLWNFD